MRMRGDLPKILPHVIELSKARGKRVVVRGSRPHQVKALHEKCSKHIDKAESLSDKVIDEILEKVESTSISSQSKKKKKKKEKKATVNKPEVESKENLNHIHSETKTLE